MGRNERSRELFRMYDGLGDMGEARLSVDKTEDNGEPMVHENPEGYRIFAGVPEGIKKIRVKAKAKASDGAYFEVMDLVKLRPLWMSSAVSADGVYDSGWLDAKDLGWISKGGIGPKGKDTAAIVLIWESADPMNGLVERVEIYMKDAED